ncbi:MAG: PAS domain S-box protein [Euryarchaeota archaeon]|nr:PAS domain S-box protein [Euryarchaeota archaeon]
MKQVSGQDDNGAVAYKVTVSVIFGLIGFAVNFYPIDFVFYGSYRMSFLIGLVFPMLITLAWGWRYGLLSALAGGCQTMWLLWVPGSSYGTLLSVPPFTLWIVWIGWFSRTRYNVRYGIYVGEIIFRVFNTVLLYTVFRWAFTLNMPPANTFMPLAVAHSIVFKEAVNGLFILFLAQALLHSEPVRRFFRLPEGEADPRYDYIYTNTIILGCTVALFFVGELHVWGSWAPDFQNAARVLGALSLFLAWLLCTYTTADIFARKRSEVIVSAEAAMHYGEYLGAIIETSHDGIFVLDAGGNFEFGNDAAFETFGWQRGELIGQTFMKVIHPDFNRFAFRRWGEVQRGEGAPYEVDIVMKDGAVRSLLISHTDMDIGGTRKYCAVMKDITERKRTEKELEKYRDRLEELVAERTTELRKANRELKREIAERKRAEAHIEHLNSVLKAIRNVNQLIVVEKDKSVMLQKACDILIEARGYDVVWVGLPVGTDDFIESTESAEPAGFTGFVSSGFAGDSTRFREAVTCGNHPPCFGDLFSRERTGVGAGAETETVRVIDRPHECGDCVFKDACPGSATAITRIEHAGMLFGLLGISFASGITLDNEEKGLLQEVAGDMAFALHSMRIEDERKVAENALAESEGKYRLLADNSIECIWQMNPDFKFTYVNPSVLRMFGFTPDEWIGSSLSEHCSPESLEFMSGLASTVLANGPELADVTFETQLFHKNGEPVPVEITSRMLFDEDGSLAVFQGSTRDIRERKAAEAKLTQTLADLKRSNAELAEFAHAASHDLQEPLRMISSYVQLLSRRYRGKLDSDADEFIGFAVDGAKQMHRLIDDLLTLSRVGTRGAGFAEIHLDDALEMSLADLSESIRTNGVVVTYDPLPAVVASASQLTWLFKNLIENAIKFRSKDPPRIRISAAQKGALWEFSVADNGIGIESQYFDRIFKVFQRLHPANEYPGTGIGLALSRKIVERHGGRMWVESEPGQGATFYFTIPVGAGEDDG